MNSLLFDIGHCFFTGQLPFARIKQIVYFFFLFFKRNFHLSKLIFHGGLILKDLLVAVHLISHIFEKGVKVLLQKSVLVANYVTPLDHHVVESDVYLVEPDKSVRFREFIQNIP
jgi:hypothetical protein